VIVCPRCSKENQDHYKFCLGCGAELPRNAAHQPKAFTAPTPPAGVPAPQAAAFARAPTQVAPDAPTQIAPVSEPRRSVEPASVPAQAPAQDALTCPKCSSSVPRSFKFCGSCGHPMAAVAAAAAAPAPAPVPASAPAAVSFSPTRGNLVLIRPDGSEGETIPLADITLVGRQSGGVFGADLYLSPRHATLSFEGGQLFVKDEQSLNGVYVRIDRDAPIELRDGAIFRLGQELLRFNSIEAVRPDAAGVEVMGSPNPGYIGRLSLVIGRSTTANSFPIPPQGLHLGRERGDLIFPEDGYVSGLHARIHGDQGRVFLTDVGSSNGTFVRLVGKQPVRSGDLLLMGQQLFRAEY
jgi:pSer/pThr/pTyr-binding forkhead associated (FHA) protein